MIEYLPHFSDFFDWGITDGPPRDAWAPPRRLGTPEGRPWSWDAQGGVQQFVEAKTHGFPES